MVQHHIKLGISAFAWTSQFTSSHLTILPLLRKAGLQGFEVPMIDPELLPVEDIRAASEENGLECTVCALLPKSRNPISSSSSERLKAIEHLKRCIEASAAMGARLLCGPLFAPIGYLPKHRPSIDEWSWAVEAFQALRSDLEANQLILAIEPVNRAETFFLRTGAEAKHLCESIGGPLVGVTVDTFHANIEEQSIPDAIRSLGNCLKHVHASENDRGPLGRGHVPFNEIVSALRQIRYEGYLMIEGFGFSPKERIAPGKLWASKDVSPEALLEESAGYLRNLLQ